MGALDNKVSIVTGGGTGIGRSAAIMLAEEGSTVVLVGRRREPLEETARIIEGAGGTATIIPADLEDGDAAATVAETTVAKHGRIDILVNNAGHSSRVRSMKYVGPEEFQSVFKVNVEGVYRLTQAAVRDMIQRREGTVITVSSMAAIRPGLLGGIPYSAAKAAVYNMMQCMNTELRAEGIRATTILPAEVDTPILNNRPLPPDDQARATMMQPEDIASAILLCATMPHRTFIEEMTLLPTRGRDVSADMKAAKTIQSPDQHFSKSDL